MINIQNIDDDDDDECFKWCLVRYLNPADHYPARITKAGKDFFKKLDFKDIKFPVKVRDIHKMKKRILSAIVFLAMKIKKNIQSMYQKMFQWKTCWLIIDSRRRKKHSVFINDFNRFMYDHYIVKKNIFVIISFMLSLQKKYYIVIFKTALKSMVKKRLRWLRAMNMLNLKILKEKWNRHDLCKLWKYSSA